MFQFVDADRSLSTWNSRPLPKLSSPCQFALGLADFSSRCLLVLLSYCLAFVSSCFRFVLLSSRFVPSRLVCWPGVCLLKRFLRVPTVCDFVLRRAHSVLRPLRGVDSYLNPSLSQPECRSKPSLGVSQVLRSSAPWIMFHHSVWSDKGIDMVCVLVESRGGA